MRKVSDVFKDHKDKDEASSVFPGIPRVHIDNLFNYPLEILDVRWLRADPGFHSFAVNGRSLFAVLLCRDPETRGLLSTHTGSIPICRKLRTLMVADLLPVVGRFIERPDNSYDLI